MASSHLKELEVCLTSSRPQGHDRHRWQFVSAYLELVDTATATVFSVAHETQPELYSVSRRRVMHYVVKF
jgi:hypothetical protein